MSTKTTRIQYVMAVMISLTAFTLAIHAAEDVRYSIGTATLDGSVGENTYVANSGSASTGGATLSKGSSQLVFGLNTKNPNTTDYGLLIGYFAPVSLGTVGSSITLEYAVTVSTTTPASLFNANIQSPFRIGFFDSSNGTSQKLEGNYQWKSSSRFTDYTGYTANLGGSGQYGSLNQRVPNDSNQELVVGLSQLKSTKQRIGYSGGIPNFTGTFKLERISDTEIRITSTLFGTETSSESIVASSNLLETFDTFAIAGFAGSDSSALTFTQLTVTATTPIPESGTWALLLGATGLLFALALRRHQQR